MTFNPNIPQSSDIPSQSQAQFLTNFGQLNTIFDIDHVTFNDATSANRGYHRKVRLVDVSADPLLSSPQTQLYTKTLSGVQQLFFANASSATQITGTKSLSTKGYATLPGGLIIQWNKLATVTDGLAESFAITFPTQAFAVTVTQITATSLQPVCINNLAAGGFNFRVSGAGIPVSYIAVGY